MGLDVLPGDREAERAFAVSAISSAAVLFAVGWTRAFLVRRPGILGGLEMLLIGTLAGAVAYAGGAFVEEWIS